MALRILKTTLLFLAFALPALAQDTNGPCVIACFTSAPLSSQCNGDETGDALATCTCASYTPGNLQIACIEKCPTSEQQTFVSHLPAKCQNTVIPGITAASSGSSTSASASPSASAAGSTASSGTSSTPATPTTSGSSGSSSTSASTSAKASGNVGAVYGVQAVNVGAFVGAVAVLVL